MSARYVWEISYQTSDKYKSEITDYTTVISGPRITFFKDYDFDEKTGVFSQTGSGSSFSPGSISGNAVIAPVSTYGRYASDGSRPMRRIYQASLNQANWDVFLGSNGQVTANLIPIGGSYGANIVVRESKKVSSGSTEVLRNVSADSRSAYKDGVDAQGYTYTFLGSDSIDPYSVTYSKTELQSGEGISISASARNPVYGGTVYYQFEYSVDGGNTWTSIGSETKKLSVTMTIPAGAKQFQARVTASDTWGFTSTTPVYGTNLGVSALKAYVSPAGKARAATKIKVSPAGKAREVVKGYIGVNGKARKFM